MRAISSLWGGGRGQAEPHTAAQADERERHNPLMADTDDRNGPVGDEEGGYGATRLGEGERQGGFSVYTQDRGDHTMGESFMPVYKQGEWSVAQGVLYVYTQECTASSTTSDSFRPLPTPPGAVRVVTTL